MSSAIVRAVERDLGEVLYALTRALIAGEEPVLAACGLTMWEYAVLSRLSAGDVRRDKTRIIPLLDGLEARGLLRRTPDPDDRRNKVVALTAEGRALAARTRAAIRAMEEELLAGLGAGGRAALREALAAAAG